MELKAKMKPWGCKQDIMTLLVTLFSICKVGKIVFKTFNLPLTSQIKWNLNTTYKLFLVTN
jgi:hypothetical protein